VSALRRFFLILVAAIAALPLVAAVPAPENHFGQRMGADGFVLDWDRVVAYFQALERGSGSVQVRELGKTTEGRPFLAVTIAAPETLKNLDRFSAIQARLADPRATPEAAAEALIAEGKAVVLITCSIHSTELASTQTAIELVYKLLTEDTPRHRAILDNVILLLVPSLNPDGLDMVAQWYRGTFGTKFEGANPPELYHKYAGHDNNRDWYFFTQAETRLTVSQLHNVWHPQIVYDVHQQGPYAARMFVPPWLDPVDPNIDPIVVQESNSIGAGMAADLTAAGKAGVVINALYDLWSPARHFQAYHGGVRVLSESASARLASPITVRPGEIETSALGYAPRERSWNYLEPWLGGEWRLRDIVDYQLIAMESLLSQAALRRQDLLRAFYRIGERSIARIEPAAFVITSRQADPGAARKLLETLAFGQVEIQRAGGAFEAGGRSYPAGSYLVLMRQPYGGWAKTLLERQRYPDLRQYPGGPPKRPYDVTAHTLPLLLGVEAGALDALPAAPLEAAAGGFHFAGNGNGRAGRLAGSDSDSWIAVNRVWRNGGTVWREASSGDFLTEASSAAEVVLRPRIAVYRGYPAIPDEGWTRWVLEQFGFEYSSAGRRAIEGDLRRRFDVLIFPDQSPAALDHGLAPGSAPAEFTGGLGTAGIAALKRFASEGGTLVFLNNSAGWAADRLGLPVKNVVGGLSTTEFYSPGSLVSVRLDRSSSLARGLPEQIAVWSESSPAWEAPERSPARVIARYPVTGILASGWLLGEKYLSGKAAVVECPVGKGRVVLFGMRPQYRGQSWQTLKLFFNSLLAGS
jgi:hypothetical protein